MKHRSTRERQEAEMRLRNSAALLKRLQLRLTQTGHPEGDPWRASKLREFWEKVRSDKRMVRGDF